MISIRPAETRGAQPIGKVFDAAVLRGWTFLGDLRRERMFSSADWDNLVIEYAAAPNVLLVAVDDSANVIGFTAARLREGELYLLFVHPTHGGRGVGHALLDAAHEALRAAGCHEVYLYTNELNERSLAVYGAAGYRRDGSLRESEFRGVHLREPRLVKSL